MFTTENTQVESVSRLMWFLIALVVAISAFIDAVVIFGLVEMFNTVQWMSLTLLVAILGAGLVITAAEFYGHGRIRN